MSIRFVRWDLVTNGQTTAVLRLQAGDVLMTDVGGTDCFDAVLAAAEAAWRLAGPPVGDGSWLDAAQSAMNEDAAGILSATDTPRIVTSQAMAQERIKWLEDDDGLTPSTGEWMLGNASGRGVASLTSADYFDLPEATTPLSGLRTAEWRLIGRAVEAAGPPKDPSKKAAALEPPHTLPPAEGALAGKRTSEWPFASIAGRGVRPDTTEDGE